MAVKGAAPGASKQSQQTVPGLATIRPPLASIQGDSLHGPVAQQVGTSILVTNQVAPGAGWVNLFAIGYNMQPASGNVQIPADAVFVPIDATGGNITAALPSLPAQTMVLQSQVSKTIIVKRVDSSGNSVTLYPTGAATIDGNSSQSIASLASYTFVYANGVWSIV